MNILRRLILEDMKPALGVTEPAAIALACAKARSLITQLTLPFRKNRNGFLFVSLCETNKMKTVPVFPER